MLDGLPEFMAWHCRQMGSFLIPCRRSTPKRPRDLNQWAKRMVDIATGEVEDKQPVASAVKGGVARARSLTPQQRAQIAKDAADARWKKSKS
jgi:hypothetical protein